jgi:hypothetical protein
VGASGPGLYSNDYAADLKATISAVARLPHDAAHLLELLVSIEEPARLPNDEDYTTFWLVVADQFHKRGIPSDAQARARAVIADGSDVAMLRSLGMTDADLRKRTKNLQKLDDALAGGTPAKKRTTLRAPQPLLLERGAAFRYPIDSKGCAVNSYMTERDLERHPFVQVGWGAFTVVRAGHALDYLAWYQIARSPKPWRDAPTLADALAAIDVLRNGVGTLPASHIQRLRLENIGVDPRQAPPPLERDTIRTTVSDISACNLLSEWKTLGTYPNNTMLRPQEQSQPGRLAKLFKRSTDR